MPYLKSQNMGPGLCLAILIKFFNPLPRKEHILYVLQKAFFFFFFQPSTSLCSSQIFILHWGAFQGSLCFQSRFKLQRQLWKVSLESYQFFLDILFSDIILMLLQGVLYFGDCRNAVQWFHPRPQANTFLLDFPCMWSFQLKPGWYRYPSSRIIFVPEIFGPGSGSYLGFLTLTDVRNVSISNPGVPIHQRASSQKVP